MRPGRSQWTLQNARTGFGRLGSRWDEINRATHDHILLDSSFVGSLVRHFGSGNEVLAVAAGDTPDSMALVVPRGRGFWGTFQPSQGPLGMVVSEPRSNPIEIVDSLVRSLPGYALGASILQQDPDFVQLGSLEPSARVEVLPYIDTPRLTVRGSFQDYWGGLGRNLTHNLERQKRRLTKKRSDLRLLISREPGEMAECIRDYATLEQSGWKAHRGTAVGVDNAQGRFYREILEGFCERCEGVVYRLTLDDKVIASDLCVERGGMLVILKTAYDQGVKGISPGLLLHQEVFEKVFDDGRIKVIEFYGRVTGWHQKWTDEVRTMFHLNIYRHSWFAAGRRLIKSARGGSKKNDDA